MPETFNGIGTTYYGKRNLRTTHGVCERCQTEGPLHSYETRLWGVLLFIPVLPLGRRQLLDYCPRCTGHRAMSLKQWRQLSEEAIGNALESAKDAPDDQEVALRLLGTLSASQRHEEALDYAGSILEKFSDNAEVQCSLGGWHAVGGRMDEAAACYSRALEVSPGNKDARRGLALFSMNKGDLERARELLDLKDGAGQDLTQEPGVLLHLANAYQTRGDHPEALDLYRMALEIDPDLGRDVNVRKWILSSEQATGSPATLLPPRKRSYLRVAIWGGLGIVLFVLLGILNHYLATHQTVYLVNGLPVRVTVAFDGGKSIALQPGIYGTATMAEGLHEAVVQRAGADERVTTFHLENSLVQRLSKGNVFVFNVDGAATLIWENVVYSVAPDPNALAPYRFHFGKEFYAFRDIDHAFVEFPEEVRMEGRQETHARVGLITMEPAVILSFFPDGTSVARRLDFAEFHLGMNPADVVLAREYFVTGYGNGQAERILQFLGGGLDHRPVAIEWHRMYQAAREVLGRDESLLVDYDRMLADEPGNSALLYLRGRIDPDPGSAIRFHERAIEADPGNPYPAHAKGFWHALRGDFQEARPLCEVAVGLQPDDDMMASLFFEVRFALKEYASLEGELRKALEEERLDLRAHHGLLRVLVASGKPGVAREVHNELAMHVNRLQIDQYQYLVVRSRLVLEYLSGDVKAYLEEAESLSDPRELASAEFVGHLELGELSRTAELLEDDANLHDVLEPTYLMLLLSVAWTRKGDDEQARAWRDRALEQLDEGAPEDRGIAAMIRAGDDLDLSRTDRLESSLSRKALVLVVLAHGCPKHRQELARRAESMNLLGLFPYQFLKSEIAELQR